MNEGCLCYTNHIFYVPTSQVSIGRYNNEKVKNDNRNSCLVNNNNIELLTMN